MPGKRLSFDFANMVYDILVLYAGAYEQNRTHFIYVICEDKQPCSEFRFQGLFGFGGKYWSERNAISYYSEDRTKKLDKLEAKINILLGEIK
jgi:hypothetical protein